MIKILFKKNLTSTINTKFVKYFLKLNFLLEIYSKYFFNLIT